MSNQTTSKTIASQSRSEGAAPHACVGVYMPIRYIPSHWPCQPAALEPDIQRIHIYSQPHAALTAKKIDVIAQRNVYLYLGLYLYLYLYLQVRLCLADAFLIEVNSADSRAGQMQ